MSAETCAETTARPSKECEPAAALRILFLTNRLPFPIKDGQSRRTYHILKGLSEAHEVHLLSLRLPKDREQIAAVEHLQRFCKRVDVIDAPPKYLSLSMLIRVARSLVSRDPYTVWRHYSEDYLRALQRILATARVDMVHCDILPMAYVVGWIKSVPCSLTDHDVCYIKSRRIGERSSNWLLKAMYLLESWKLERFERRLFSSIDMGIAVSEVDRQALEDLTGRQDVKVVPNGVDTDEFAPSSEDAESDRLLWVGGFDYAPNHDAVQWLLSEIYPLVRARVPEAGCDLVGGGDCDGLKKETKNDRAIVFHGFVEDPVPYLRAAGVFVVPLRSGSGTRLKMLEAMAAGKAVVTTSIGAEGIEGEDGKHFLIADRSERFADLAAELLRHPKMRREIGANARELVLRKYDWRIVVRHLSEMYVQMARHDAPHV